VSFNELGSTYQEKERGRRMIMVFRNETNKYSNVLLLTIYNNEQYLLKL